VDADSTEYPLTLVVMPEPLRLTWKYQLVQFTDADARTLSARVVRILETLASAPDGTVGGIDILDAAERERILAESAAAPAAAPTTAATGATVAAALGAVVEEDPQAPAVITDDGELTYDELATRAARLARALIARGIGAGDAIAIALPRSVDAVVATWAVLAAGASVRHGAPATGDHLALTAGVLAEFTETARELPSHPVSYADRTRPLGSADPAFIVGTTALDQQEALARAAALRSEHGIDYESTTFARTGPMTTAEFLAATTAGAAMLVSADPDPDEVTHAFLTTADPAFPTATVITEGLA
jgi:non-ribosomal peptide synthetase component F